MNTKLNILKEELKKITAALKKYKPEYRKQQSKISKENIDRFGNLSKEQIKFISDYSKLENLISKCKYNYRYLHIAYCLLRGKKYEQIEPKVRENNKPNWKLIDAIKEKYSEAT